MSEAISYERGVLYSAVSFSMTNRRTGTTSAFVEGATGVFSKNQTHVGDIFTRKFCKQGDVVYTMINTAYSLQVISAQPARPS